MYTGFFNYFTVIFHTKKFLKKYVSLVNTRQGITPVPLSLDSEVMAKTITDRNKIKELLTFRGVIFFALIL